MGTSLRYTRLNLAFPDSANGCTRGRYTRALPGFVGDGVHLYQVFSLFSMSMMYLLYTGVLLLFYVDDNAFHHVDHVISHPGDSVRFLRPYYIVLGSIITGCTHHRARPLLGVAPAKRFPRIHLHA